LSSRKNMRNNLHQKGVRINKINNFITIKRQRVKEKIVPLV
jgi:hypothetical protein